MQLIPCAVLQGTGAILCPFWLESRCPLTLACDNLTRWVQALVVSQPGYSKAQPAWEAAQVLSAAKLLPHSAGAS